jgi:hypothetical protein
MIDRAPESRVRENRLHGSEGGAESRPPLPLSRDCYELPLLRRYARQVIAHLSGSSNTDWSMV